MARYDVIGFFFAMVKDEVPEAGSEPVPRQGTYSEGDILTEDRGGGRQLVQTTCRRNVA